MSALHWACDRGSVIMVQTLLKQGAEINKKVSEFTIYGKSAPKILNSVTLIIGIVVCFTVIKNHSSPAIEFSLILSS